MLLQIALETDRNEFRGPVLSHPVKRFDAQTSATPGVVRSARLMRLRTTSDKLQRRTGRAVSSRAADASRARRAIDGFLGTILAATLLRLFFRQRQLFSKRCSLLTRGANGWTGARMPE